MSRKHLKLSLYLLLLASGCHDKVCPAVPLSGQWQGYEDAIPKDTVVCGPDTHEAEKLVIQFPDKTPAEAYLQTVDGLEHWAAIDYTFEKSEYSSFGTVTFRAKTADRPQQWIEFWIDNRNYPNKGTYASLELRRRSDY